VYWSKIALSLKMRIFMPFRPKTAHFFLRKHVFEKGHYQKMFGPLFGDSVYFSESKNKLSESLG
jgi:hypothetical protein